MNYMKYSGISVQLLTSKVKWSVCHSLRLFFKPFDAFHRQHRSECWLHRHRHTRSRPRAYSSSRLSAQGWSPSSLSDDRFGLCRCDRFASRAYSSYCVASLANLKFFPFVIRSCHDALFAGRLGALYVFDVNLWCMYLSGPLTIFFSSTRILKSYLAGSCVQWDERNMSPPSTHGVEWQNATAQKTFAHPPLRNYVHLDSKNHTRPFSGTVVRPYWERTAHTETVRAI